MKSLCGQTKSDCDCSNARESYLWPTGHHRRPNATTMGGAAYIQLQQSLYNYLRKLNDTGGLGEIC